MPDDLAQALEQGYLGVNPDPRPNSAYSLESGPDAPSLLDGLRDVAHAEADRLDQQATAYATESAPAACRA